MPERLHDLYEPFLDWSTLEREMAGQSCVQTRLPVTADSPASYILTSGTTGVPKGIVYTQGQLLLAARPILAAMGPFEKDDRTLAWLPMASPFQRNMNLAALLAIEEGREDGKRPAKTVLTLPFSLWR